MIKVRSPESTLRFAHVLRLHSREPASRDPVHRGNQFAAEAARRASKRRRLLVCQSLRRFTTSKQTLIPTTLSHVNFVVYDRDWEAGFTERIEKLEDIVVSYVKNHSLNFEVPYEYGGETYRYRPDFIVRLGSEDARPVNVVVEVKGQRDAKDAAKADTMRKVWIPAVNNAGRFGRWDFLELTDIPYDIEDRLRAFARQRVAA